MTEVTLNINKSIEQNTAIYYEKAKKAKKKLKGALRAIETTKKKLAELEKKKAQEQEKIEKETAKKPKPEKKQWYENFRWFYSSEGFLCIGGRDATTNEIIIKKHTEKDDLIFHTDIAGSPFFVIKTNGKQPGKATIEETAQATASYSKAWKMGISITEVYYINQDQVKKDFGLPKGSFMIHGKRTYSRPELKLAIGIKNNKVIGGPLSAIKKNAEKYVIIVQGQEKTSSVAKQIQKKIGGSLDEIIRFVPGGGAQMKQ